MTTELEEFSRQWQHETDGTLALLRSLPPNQYDCRPDAGGRSLGELAWHLAEVDAYMLVSPVYAHYSAVRSSHVRRCGAKVAYSCAAG